MSATEAHCHDDHVGSENPMDHHAYFGITVDEHVIDRPSSSVSFKSNDSLSLSNSGNLVTTAVTSNCGSTVQETAHSDSGSHFGRPASHGSDINKSSNGSTIDPCSDNDCMHILLAATGSVATIKIPLIIGKLKQIYKDKAEIQLIVTSSAENFLKGVKIPSDVKVWRDKEEWVSRRPGIKSDSFLHATLRKWADILVIAPLSANTLAKIANGICDNLLTSVIRSWNPAIPILVAPAMNTHMYTNPMTKKHLALIKEEFGFIETLKPVEKVLVCGDIGMGGMREWADIVQVLIDRLGGPPDEDDDEDEDASIKVDEENGDEDDGDDT